MRNRKEQRALRKAGITREEKLNMRDYCGIRDPTPYEAVRNIIREQEAVMKGAEDKDGNEK